MDLSHPNTKGSTETITGLVREGFDDWSSLGHVAVRESRDGRLLLFNYTREAQYEGKWNWFERICRGLIVNRETGEIVARPFDKFFNWGEMDKPAEGAFIDSISEKLDGSLGIGYQVDGEWKVATRGSFESNQALWSTDFLSKNHDMSQWPKNLTPLWEIIYPDNRVVVNYGHKEAIVLIGMRNRFSGFDLPDDSIRLYASFHGFPRPAIFEFKLIDTLLQSREELDIGHEGWVIRYSDGQRFKVKGEAYLRAHRFLAGASYKAVWKAVRDGVFDDMVDGVPHEFLGEVRGWRRLIGEHIESTKERLEKLIRFAPEGCRKDFAVWATEDHPDDAPYLFAMLDGGDVDALILKKGCRNLLEEVFDGEETV